MPNPTSPALARMKMVQGFNTEDGTRPKTADKADHVLKVALFTDSDVFAGTERHILDLAEGLREFGLMVQIACPVPSPLAKMAREKEVPILAIQKGGVMDLGAIRKLSMLFRSAGLDLVHAHNGRTALSTVLAAIWARTGCCIFTQHFVEPGRLRCGAIQRLVKGFVHGFVNRRIDRFIAISAAVRDAMLLRTDAAPVRITTIPNGIAKPDTALFANPASIRKELGIEEGVPLIVSVARLEMEKDIPTLIEAIEHLAVACHGVRCVIVGEGSQRKELERRILASKLERNVTLAGFRSDAIAVINACDIFVLPSPAEPFGLVILEAMALGKPVIAIGNGGPLEIVVHEETGLLVAPANSNAMANAIRRLIDSPSEAALMGRAGRCRMEERFSNLRMAREIASVYKTALQVVAMKS